MSEIRVTSRTTSAFDRTRRAPKCTFIPSANCVEIRFAIAANFSP